MKRRLAYVLGCNGYVGNALVDVLLAEGVKVVGIGRSRFSKYILENHKKNSEYIYFSLEKRNINDLPEMINSEKLNGDNIAVFFNLAWRGVDSITSGRLEDQLENINLSTDSIKIASKLGCKNFVNIGSMQENYLNNFLEKDWKSGKESFDNQRNYSIAKLTCRDFNKLISYYEKINYIHCNFSVFINNNITGNGFIHNSLREIAKGNQPKNITSNQYFDLTSLSEGCRSIYLLGYSNNVNKSYYIGTSAPYKLKDIFQIFTAYRNKKVINFEIDIPDDIRNFYNNNDLYNSINFAPSKTFIEFSKEYFKS